MIRSNGRASRLLINSLLSALLALQVGCSESSGPAQTRVGQAQEALTQLSQDTLGFEALGNWSASQGSKTLSSTHTQGQKSLSLQTSGWTELESVALPSLGQRAEKFYLDLSLPTLQSNQWWLGAVQLYASIPSKNLWNQYIGQVELTGKPLGQFTPLEFAIPPSLQDALSGSYQDLKLKLTLNVPQGNGPYLFDNLRLQPVQTPTETPDAATCHPYVTVGANGDVRYQLTTSGPAQVQLFVGKNDTSTNFINQILPPSTTVLPSGAQVHTYIDAAAGYAKGDDLYVRFQVQRQGSTCDLNSAAAWATGVSYAAGTRIAYQGQLYECRQAHTSQADWAPATTLALWQVPSGCGFPSWTSSASYKVGDRVSYQGSTYEVIQAHTSQTDWTPAATPALFRVVSGTPGTPATGTVLEYKPGPASTDWSKPYKYGLGNDCVPYQDRDGDGWVDDVDECPDDPGKHEIGVCGCGTADVYSDDDYAPDCIDQCPKDGKHVARGDCGCAGNYAPAGRACDDGAAPGLFTCDGAGSCGDLSKVIPIFSGGVVDSFELDDTRYVVIKTKVSWSKAQEQAPAGFQLARIDSRKKNLILARVTSKLGSKESIWLDGTVSGPGEISHTEAHGVLADVFWDERSSPKSVGLRFTRWAANQPGEARAGCVSLSADATWSLGSCSELRYVVYERSALAIHAPAIDSVNCSDFPNLICAPNSEPNSEPCDADTGENAKCPECQQMHPDKPEECYSVCPGLKCATCLKRNCAEPCDEQPAVCAADCPELANATGTDCPEQFGKACGVVPGPTRKECATDKDCAGLVGADGAALTCGAVSNCECPPDAPCPFCKEENADGTCKVPCTSFLCGTAAEGCGVDQPEAGRCLNRHLCSEKDAEFAPNPTDDGLQALTLEAEAQPVPTPVKGAQEPRLEPRATQYPDESPSLPPGKTDPAEHPFCHYTVDGPPNVHVGDAKSGKAGKDKALSFSVDPNLTLNYELHPLPLGQLKFELDAAASLDARADFNIGPIKGHVDILSAMLSATASRCGYDTSKSKLELFGYDFLPQLTKEYEVLQPLDRRRTAPGCEEALQAYQELVDRVKKTMKDAQELLTQYHAMLRGEICLNPQELCASVFNDKTPAGYASLDCSDPKLTVEDIVNTFIFNYHRLIGGAVKLPKFSGKLPTFPNAGDVMRDWRLPDISLPSVEGIDDADLNFGEFDKLNPMPSLKRAAAALGQFKLPDEEADPGKLDPKWADLYGCQGVQGEPVTLFSQPFALGPIPMLLEVQSVVKYGLGGSFKFDYDPDAITQLAVGSDLSAKDIATVQVKAAPCVSAGLALFVGAGFKGYGFRATAGVEGIVNLGTLSAPGLAEATVSMSAEDEGIDLSPVAAPTSLKGGARAAREIARELKGLWDGGKLPIKQRRFNVGVKYKYGLSLRADEILAGHLKVALQIKFWRWRKRWSKYLVNLGNGFALPEKVLVGGGGGVLEMKLPVPWGVVQMPSPFVTFRYLDAVNWTDKNGLDPKAISASLPSFPISVGSLGALDKGLDQLGGFELSPPQLADIGKSLGFRDLTGELGKLGLDLDHLTFADLAKLGLELDKLSNVPLTIEGLQVLGLSATDLSKLGIELPVIALDHVSLSGVSLAELGRLDLPDLRLDQVEIDWRDLPALAFALSAPDLEERLVGVGADLNELRLGDFRRAGFEVEKFRAWPLTPADVLELGLTASELTALGVDLSGISLDLDDSLDSLVQRGVDLAGLSYADLSVLGYSLADLSAIKLPHADLFELSSLLGFPDLGTALKEKGVDLGHVTLADFGKLGVGISEISNLSLESKALLDKGLNLSASDVVKLGLGSKLADVPLLCDASKKAKLDTSRVGSLYYDRQCAACQRTFDEQLFRANETHEGDKDAALLEPLHKGEQSCSTDADCCGFGDGARCVWNSLAQYKACALCGDGDASCTRTEMDEVTDLENNNKLLCNLAGTQCTQGDVLEQEISKSFGGDERQPLQIVHYRVLLENGPGGVGTVDDKGYAVSSSNPANLQQVTGEPVCGQKQIGKLISGVDITKQVEQVGSNDLRFKFRAKDVCGFNVGYNNIRVHWLVTLAPSAG